MKALYRKIAQIMKNRAVRKRFRRWMSVIAAVVVFITTYATVLPAITLEKTASCGIEEHQHSDECYDDELICGQEESEGHHHDDSCYTVTRELVCQEKEHQHSEENGCYDEEGNLICELSEHVHDDSCYKEVETLTCGQEESEGHHHTEACYKKVLVCGKEEHIHSTLCYESGEDQEEDTSAESVPENAAAGNSKETAVDQAEEEIQTGNYLPELDPVVLEAMFGKHTGFYYYHPEEEEELPESSTEIRDWQELKDDTVLASGDLVRMYLQYSIPAGSLNLTNTVTRYRLPENIHLTDKQIRAVNSNKNGFYNDYKTSHDNADKYLGAEAIEGDRRPDEDLKDGDTEYISAVVSVEESSRGEQDLIFTFVPYTIEKNQTVYDADKNPVSAGDKITGWFACDFTMEQIDWKEEKSIQEESTAAEETEKTAEIILAHEDKDREIREISHTLRLAEQPQEEDKKEEAAPSTVEFKAGSLTARGADYTVTLDYTEEAQIPENAELTVREITQKSNKEIYEDCLAQAEDHVAESGENQSGVDAAATRFFDIEIVIKDEDGTEHKVEPASPVNVSILIQDAAADERTSAESRQDPTVLHFGGDGVETIDSTTAEASEKKRNSGAAANDEKTEEIRFEAESFSIYGVVYTVDFHWDVNGKKYDFSIPGGGFVSLADLVEVLGITGDNNSADDEADNQEKNTEQSPLTLGNMVVSEETRKFVEDVESVEFSSPELVWVGKVENDSTVGVLKEANRLECQYSAELTEEQIAEINAQTVEAGDWALISLQPFTSEETLTVTMKNGDRWTVNVTDEQVTDSLTDGGKYLIYYNTGSGNNQTYHVLKKNGEVYHTTNKAALDTLGDEYLWTFDYYSRIYEGYFLIHNGSTYIALNGTTSGIFSNNATPTYMIPYEDSAKGYYVFGREWVQTGWLSGEYVYHYLVFNNNKFALGDENGNTRIKLWEQEERKYQFTVKTEYSDVYRGTVSGKDQSGNQKNNVASFVSITNTGKTNAYSITANPSEGYHFKEWKLGENVLTTFKTATIPAGRLTFTEDNMILTAVFERNEGSSGGGETDYSSIINEWKDQHVVSEMNLDKTAQVHDYDNRIYQVDLTASGKATVIIPNMQLAFVTDVSRSMYFPAELGSRIQYRNTDAPGTVSGYSTAKDFVVKILDQYRNKNYAPTHSADGDDVYYLIADPNGKSTVYAVRKDTEQNKWMYIDASFDVTKYPKKGANKTGQWTVQDDSGKQVGWKALSEHVTFENGRLKLEGYDLDGYIYVAKDVKYRLDYLQQAVDAASEVVYAVNPSAEIGLVTFAGSANDPVGLYGKDKYGQLLYHLQDISPEGGTNQKDGLDKAKQFWQTGSDPDHQRAVIMITDGAPNPKSGTLTWNDIANSAGQLYNQKNAKVHTVGLSIENVTGAEAGLKKTAQAGGNGKSFSAKNSEELVKDILKIVEEYLKEANLKGTLHDDIDRVFYPVKQDGSPIEPGFYRASDGEPIDLETVQSYNDSTSSQFGTEYYLWKDNEGQWSITWYNLEFGKGTEQSPSTKKSFYLKAREDFMGGNKIKTNVDEAHAIGSQAVIGTGSKILEQPLEKIVDAMAETPFVNVDELHLTEHSTEWTVYLGTDVTPKDQLKRLWDNIKVKQVVKNTQGDHTMMNDKNQMWYEHSDSVNTNDTAVPANSDSDDKLALSHYGLDSYYTALLAAITNGASYDSGEIPYQPYNHDTIGCFRITATKQIVDGAKDAVNKAPELHTTDKAASPAETYKITVTYKPLTDGSNTVYNHTTPLGSAGNVTTGTGNDEVESENVHQINVIKKGLEVQKVDEEDVLISNYPATFKLYRPAQTGETGMNVEGVGSGYVEVATLTTSNGKAILPDTVEELRKLPEGQHYFLVETQEPSGYAKLTAPIQIDLSVTDGAETMPYETSENITDLINIGTPTAEILVDSTDARVLSDADGKFAIKVINKPGSVDIEIHKVNDKNVPLSGAVFKIIKGSEIVEIATSGTGVIVEPKVPGETVTIADNTFTIPIGGVTIKNLKTSEDIYSIIEVSPPEGYIVTNNTPAAFKVSGESLAEVQTIEGVTYTSTSKDFVVPNEPGSELPMTGGPGTNMIYLIGMTLIGLAGAGSVIKRRRKNAA